MKDTLTALWLAADVANHLVPLLISIGVVVGGIVLSVFYPQMKYIELVSKAVDDAGVIELAKHLAKKNGGKHINTDHLWENFVPAAKAIVREYLEKHKA